MERNSITALRRGLCCASQQILGVEDRFGSKAVNLRLSISLPVHPRKQTFRSRAGRPSANPGQNDNTHTPSGIGSTQILEREAGDPAPRLG
jgi:hypothetical protein